MGAENNFKKGLDAYQLKKFETAIHFFSEAIKINSLNVNFYYHRGLSYFHFKKKKEALADFKYSIKLEPNNPFRYSCVAYVLDSLGNTEKAIEMYRITVKLDPEDAVAHNNLGLLEEKLGYKEQSKRNLERADKLAKKTPSLETALTELSPEEEEKIDAFIQEQKLTVAEDTESNSSPLLSKKSILKEVVSSKDGFSEFIRFMLNGFKLKD